MLEKTQRELGWPQILEALAGLARTPVGRERSFELPFLDAREQILLHLGRIAEARKLMRNAEEIPLADTPDARVHLTRASREGVLEAPAVMECARLIRSGTRVRRFLLARKEVAPALAGEAEALGEFDPLAAEIERAIEPSGNISDNASPLLAELRGRTRGLHRALKGRIDDILRDEQMEEVLRDRYYSIRDDRYVVPVKTSHGARLPGIVHNASQTGQTLFVEPDALVDLGNQLTIAQSMAVEEERRILRDLSDAIGRRAEHLTHDTLLLAEFDRVSAAARLADRLNAEEPRIGAPGDRFALRKLRHPLLALRGTQVIANDVKLDAEKHALVISGPNAGGKTVTVTAVGLVSLMARAGLPIPAAEGSLIPLFRSVHTAIGDQGDLARGLSTFTAHLTALCDIVRTVQPGDLVCIDEIAADTDPREGAAIAVAILEAIVEAGADVLITTHLEEVKAKGLTDPRFVSASMAFDLERLVPTYTLDAGRIGASSAIEIARRVGLPESICLRAREVLGGSGGALDEAVGQMDRERESARRRAAELEDERRKLVAEREEHERARVALQTKEREVTAAARRDLLVEIEAVRDQVRHLLAELQGQATVRAAVEAQAVLEQTARDQEVIAAREETRTNAEEAGEAIPVAELKPGLRVRVASVGHEGEILSLAGGFATVVMGALKTRVPVADLIALTGHAKQSGFRKTAAEKKEAIRKVTAAPVASRESSLDLRGMRTEDALRALRSELDLRVREETGAVSIIHGHGSGALKKAVREELESSPYAAAFRSGQPEEGGDGVTVVTLRGS